MCRQTATLFITNPDGNMDYNAGVSRELPRQRPKKQVVSWLAIYGAEPRANHSEKHVQN